MSNWKIGDLVRIDIDHIYGWFGDEWVCEPVQWSKDPYKVLAVEAEGKRLIVNSLFAIRQTEAAGVSNPQGFGVTAQWCEPYE